MTRIEMLRLTAVGVVAAIVTVGLYVLLNYNDTAAYIAAPIVVIVGTIGLVKLAHRTARPAK
jgi:putative flippase GtrA